MPGESLLPATFADAEKSLDIIKLPAVVPHVFRHKIVLLVASFSGKWVGNFTRKHLRKKAT